MTELEREPRPVPLCVLIAVMAVQAGGGLVGGIGLVLDPTGELLQLPVDMLGNSPFASFLIPGVILLTLLGITPAAVTIGLWKCTRWAWRGSLLVSVALIIWITVEIALVGFHPEPPLQVVFAAVGVTLLLLTLLRGVRTYLAAQCGAS